MLEIKRRNTRFILYLLQSGSCISFCQPSDKFILVRSLETLFVGSTLLPGDLRIKAGVYFDSYIIKSTMVKKYHVQNVAAVVVVARMCLMLTLYFTIYVGEQ